MSCVSKFSSYVSKSLTFSLSSSMSFLHIQHLLLDWNCSSSSLVFVTFFTVFILFTNCFNKFISSIFTSKNNHWLGKLIINTNNFVSKTTRNVILILFIFLKQFSNLIVLFSNLTDWCSFFSINAQTNAFMLCQHIFTTKTL